MRQRRIYVVLERGNKFKFDRIFIPKGRSMRRLMALKSAVFRESAPAKNHTFCPGNATMRIEFMTLFRPLTAQKAANLKKRSPIVGLTVYHTTKGYRDHEVSGEIEGKQMQFMCLIYSDPAEAPKPGTDEFGPFMHGYQTFTENVKRDGKMVHADALQGVETATCVAVRGGKTEIMDGPFAETKEHLGGYYLLECADLDEAVRYAAQIPTAEHGRIEVRPVMVWET